MTKVIRVAMGTAMLAVAMVGGNVGANHIQAKAEQYKTAMAEYVSKRETPIIDGVMDEIWTRTGIIQTKVSAEGTFATVRIMWNESGLYYFADVTDYTTNKSDLCNLWIDESFVRSEKYYNSSSIIEAYPFVDEAYYLLVSSEGKIRNAYYKNSAYGGLYDDLDGVAEIGSTQSQTGYTIEAYVPMQGNTALKEGSSIGFDVSIDDYLEPNEERHDYVYWNGGGKYWEMPILGKVELCKRVKDEETKGCFSTLTAVPYAFIGLCAVALLKKKK